MTQAVKDWLTEQAKLDLASKATGLLKSEIVTDGLGGVALTLNGYDSAFQALADKAFTLMAARPSNQNFFLSGSLGSWLLFDHVRERSEDPNVLAVMEKTKEWYMFTNQLALIQLTEMPLKVSLEAFYEQSVGRGDPLTLGR